MKRGKNHPQVRSRWSLGPSSGSAYGPPTRIKTQFSFEFIADPTHPGVITVISGGDRYARWSYEQSNASVVWFIDWIGTDPLYSGQMEYKQIPSDDATGCIAQVRCIFTYTGAFPYATVFTLTDHGAGTWNPFGGDFGFRFGFTGLHDVRMIGYVFDPLAQLTYQEAEALGFDSHNTAPITWNY